MENPDTGGRGLGHGHELGHGFGFGFGFGRGLGQEMVVMGIRLRTKHCTMIELAHFPEYIAVIALQSIIFVHGYSIVKHGLKSY